MRDWVRVRFRLEHYPQPTNNDFKVLTDEWAMAQKNFASEVR